jgi:hypothetical protein
VPQPHDVVAVVVHGEPGQDGDGNAGAGSQQSKPILHTIPGLWIRIGSGSALGIRIPDPDQKARKLRKISSFSVKIIYFYNGKV